MILVVDDYSPARELYARILRIAGYSVEEAHDGKEALEKSRRLRPDLILMDLMMPGMDGWGVIKELRTLEGSKDRPIAVITGMPEEEAARRAKEAGCEAFLVKPVLPNALLRMARDLLGGKAAG